MEIIPDEIFERSDLKYKEFQKKLIPTVSEETILGLRSPIAHSIAKKYACTKVGIEFLDSLPHRYYDENIVHAFMLGRANLSHKELLKRLDEFLPYVDNWAVCDGLCSHIKSFFKDLDISLPFVLECVKSDKTYTVRFGLVSLLNYYISEKYIDLILETAVSVNSQEYYINMADAWLISFCLIKEYEKTVPIIEKGILPKWVHNKSIQKAIESYRLEADKKEYLRGLKLK